METTIAVLVGLGLAAACGFRVFVPFLVLGIAANEGMIGLSPSFDWIASEAARMAFGTASVLEVLAYYVPWLDNLLDAVAAPAAVLAGTAALASVVTDLPPFLKWSLAIIAGGGAAGAVHGATAALRAGSSVATGGAANPLIATAELGGAALTPIVAIALPVVCAVLVGAFLVFVVRKRGRLLLLPRPTAGERARNRGTVRSEASKRP